MNKRQAKIIMELLDGFDWIFLNNETYIVGTNSLDEIMIYEMVFGKLIKMEMKRIKECLQPIN